MDINELLIHLLTLLNNNLMVDGISINVTSTVGAAIYPVHGEEDDVLVNHAIIAVYQARKETNPMPFTALKWKRTLYRIGW